MKKVKKGRVGASFDDFLKEEGIYEEVTARAKSRTKLRRQKKVGAAFGKYTRCKPEKPRRPVIG